MKLSVITFGCKVNQYESQELLCSFRNNGFETVSSKDKADVYIVNSCTVTEESSRKVKQKLRSLRNTHPEACIVLTGCFPQAFSEEAVSLNEADIICGNRSNSEILKNVNKWFNKKEQINAYIPHHKNDKYTGLGIDEFEGHTRAFIKIQDGCNRYCTYCIIPKARGFSRSKPLEDIKRELFILSSKGFKEVVFVGINLSSYGMDCGLSICDAIEAAQNTDGIERIRLGSLEPDHITPTIIDRLSKCNKFCPQFHLSLQSGDDRILKRMNRHYTVEEYTVLCNNLKKVFPDVSITTDIITGFPGETDEAFNNSILFAEKIGFMKIHAFPFSPRKGTPAYSYSGAIDNRTKSERVNILMRHADVIRTKFMNMHIGIKTDVLFESPKNGYQLGYTKNYIPIAVKTSENLKGQIRNVVIDAFENDQCLAHLSD